MEEKVKKILQEKNLFIQDKELDLEKSNNLNKFLENYHEDTFKNQYKNFGNNLPRNNNGFIILDEVPFIYSNHSYCCKANWLLFNDGTKVFLKKPDDWDENVVDALEQEIFIEYFLKNININCAKYEPAILNGKKYLIVPSFLNKNDTLFTIFNRENGLEVNQKLSKTFSNEVFFLKTAFADRIYGNPDRLPRNYGIILDSNTFKNCPLFDNGELLFYRDDEYFPKLKNGSNNMNDVIAYLLQNDEIMHWVTHDVKKANLQSIVEKLKREKGFIISNSTYKAFETFFKDSEAIINEELKNKGKSFKISLV